MIEKIKGKVVLFMLLGGCISLLTACHQPLDKTLAEENQGKVLKATLLKVGKADAIVIQEGENTMVIDAGEEEDGEEVVEFLENQGISNVDTLIITHYDQDHVGGADTLVEAMEIGQVLLPAYEGDSTEYVDFMNALERKEIQPEFLTEEKEFYLGEAKVLAEPPLSYENEGGAAEFDNNYSIITTVTYGKNNLLFTGDIEKQRIREWLENGEVPRCTFLKIPHHGIYNTALKELLTAVAPKYAVICSSNKNPADTQTLELLKQRNISVMETKDGNITVLSDGNDMEINQQLEYE